MICGSVIIHPPRGRRRKKSTMTSKEFLYHRLHLCCIWNTAMMLSIWRAQFQKILHPFLSTFFFLTLRWCCLYEELSSKGTSSIFIKMIYFVCINVHISTSLIHWHFHKAEFPTKKVKIAIKKSVRFQKVLYPFKLCIVTCIQLYARISVPKRTIIHTN